MDEWEGMVYIPMASRNSRLIHHLFPHSAAGHRESRTNLTLHTCVWNAGNSKNKSSTKKKKKKIEK